MIRSKASAALLRLKEIDKKYRVRQEDTKQDLSSDNTESLLREPAEAKTNTQPVSVIEEQEILKPTLNIKIPDTFTEQLESQSSSNGASPSVRVSVVNEAPVPDPKNDSQSISEIQEELEDVESISEVLDDSDNSGSENAKKSPKEEIEKSKMKEITAKNISMGKKQLENYVLSELHSNDYSHSSFESYSSVFESHSQSDSESDVHGANNSISALNRNKNDNSFSSKEILDTRKFAESMEKKKEEKTTKFAESIEKNKEEKTAKFAESIETKKEDKTAKFAESIEKKKEENTAKFAESIEKKKEERTAKFAESMEKKKEERTAKIAESIEKKEEERTAKFAGIIEEKKEEKSAKFAGSIKKDITPEDISEDDEIPEESSKSVEATDSFRNISRESEPHGKSKSKQSKNENFQIKKQEDQEEENNSFDTKLPRDKSKQKDFEVTDKRDLRTELLSGVKSRNSSRQKSEENIRKVSKINDEMESEKEFSSLETKILSREKSQLKINKRKDPGNGTTVEKEEITAKFVDKDNKAVISEDIDEIDEEVEESSKSVEATDSFRTISKNSETIAGIEELKSKRSKRKKLKIKKQENEKEVHSITDQNSFDAKLPRDESKQKILEDKDRRSLREKLSSRNKSSNSSQQKSEENRSKRKVSKTNDELDNEKQFSSSEAKIFSRENSERNKSKVKDSSNGISGNSEMSSSSLLDANASITKSSQNRSRTTDFELVDKTEEEKSSSSAKEDFPHQKLDNNKTALFSHARRTKRTSSQLLRGPRRYVEKSSDYSEGVGNGPAVDGGLSESSSRVINSQRKFEHRNLALRLRDAEKRFSKSADKTVQRSQSAVEIGETRERKNLTNVRRKKLHQNSKVYGYIQEKNRRAKTSKSSTCCRVNEMRHARKDLELERFNMRLRDLRLEQERQLMLCYMRDFKEDRLLLWPNRFYCAGKPEASIIKPLKFENVLKFVKPDSTTAKVDLVFPDNHLAMLKDRVVEIRQWLKDQFILYQDYSDVAAAINAKYVAESEKITCQPKMVNTAAKDIC